MKKTWFITGASRGFGRIWAKAALERGDKVTATNDACSFRNSGDQRDWNRKRSEIGWGDRTGKCEWSCPLFRVNPAASRCARRDIETRLFAMVSKRLPRRLPRG
jgi:NAD(P)-dependent dehydrogenase (short-subunit alcohol dehydrogenase family)